MREVVVSSLTASQGPALEICKGAVRSRESAAPLHSPLGPLFSSVSQKGGSTRGKPGLQDSAGFPLVLSFPTLSQSVNYFVLEINFCSIEGASQ